MKEIIEKSGLKLQEFAERYGIPYNTVRQWYNGERHPAEWVKKLIKEKTEYKPLLEIADPDCIIYEYYNKEGLKYRAYLPNERTEEQIDWFNSLQRKYKDGKEGLIKRKIYKAYLYNVDRKGE